MVDIHVARFTPKRQGKKRFDAEITSSAVVFHASKQARKRVMSLEHFFPSLPRPCVMTKKKGKDSHNFPELLVPELLVPELLVLEPFSLFPALPLPSPPASGRTGRILE